MQHTDIHAERARKDVYGRRIGCPSTTGRILYKPPPNFTIQQLRQYKKRKAKQALYKNAGLLRNNNNTNKNKTANPKNLLLLNDNIQAFNQLVQHKHPPLKTHQKKQKERPTYEKPKRSHTQDCKELRTVIEKFRDDYYYTPIGEKIKGAHFPEATSWFKGQWVECLHQKRWHPGQIAAIHLTPSFKTSFKNGLQQKDCLTFDIKYPWLGSLGNDLNVPEHHVRWMPIKRHWYKGEPVVVNWLGRGNWYTASVARVHNDGSNSVDIIFDDGRTVGCVNGPKYLTRCDNSWIQQVKWYQHQPVLAQYRGRGLWYRAHIIKVEQRPKIRKKMSPVFKGADKKEIEGEDDEECKVTVQYDGLGGGQATESGVTRKLLRPWLGDFAQDLALPVSESDNFGSSIESIFVPSAALPSSINLAWFWGTRSNALMLDNNDQGNNNNNNNNQEFYNSKTYTLKKHSTSKQKKIPGTTDGNVPLLRAPLLSAASNQYSLDGHVREKKHESHQQKSNRLAKKRRARSAKLKRVDAELNAAVHAAASPDQLITLSRQGPGLEKITVRMKHKDLGGAGLVLQKFVSSIDGVGYRAGKPIIKFYVTVKPGLYEEFSSEMHSLSQGTATISLATEHEKKVHFSGSTTGHGAISNSVERLVSLVRHSNGSRNTMDNNKNGTLQELILSITHLEIVTFLNWCRQGKLQKVQQLLHKYQMLVVACHATPTDDDIDSLFTNSKTNMNPLLSATLGGHLNIARLLMKSGFNPNFTDKSDRSALKVARQNLQKSQETFASSTCADRKQDEHKHMFDTVQLWQKFVGLLVKDVSVYQAAMMGDVNRLRHLEKINNEKKWLTKPNKYGITPLHLAVMHGQLDAVKWLNRRVDSKAWQIMNRVGQTPDDLCVTAPMWSDELMGIAESRR